MSRRRLLQRRRHESAWAGNLDFEIGKEMSRRSFEDEDPALDRVWLVEIGQTR